MILASLVGSEGLLGSTFVKMNAVQGRKISGSTMVMMGTEAAHLIEILGDCLHNRGKTFLRNHLKHEVGSHAATQLQLRLGYLLFDGVL